MAQSDLPAALTNQTLNRGVAYLTEVDDELARIVDEIGPPPMWAREPGFPTLVQIILEQQVSLASARAAFIKLTYSVRQLAPERFLELTDAELREIGFSRQKSVYCHRLSEAILKGELDLQELGRLADNTVRTRLMQVKGIGPWTADIYLLMALLRPDAWPAGDLAIAKAVQRIKELPLRPSPEMLDQIGEQWRPWRAVAARILWHHYLNGEY